MSRPLGIVDLAVGTGHGACWGEDPIELLPWADLAQLRQVRPGVGRGLQTRSK